MDTKTYPIFSELAEIFEDISDESVDQLLNEMEPKKFNVEEYLNSNYDY
jgi:hypothetical protein|tara:strand:+ start:50087 stop:50233 length:147 start_codon:yes stop_codon:yes gene_type:complete